MDLAEQVIERARKFGGKNPQQQSYLLQLCEKMPSDILVRSLLSIFDQGKDPEVAIEEQELAGFLLLWSARPCPLPIADVLLMLLKGWNLSVEEVPWYLVDQFGPQEVLERIQELIPSISSSEKLRRLETLAFWVRNYEGPHASPAP